MSDLNSVENQSGIDLTNEKTETPVYNPGFQAKREARIERLRDRAARRLEAAKGEDLSLFGESRSGIPMGQPILVGHHSEARHRRALERIEARVRRGFANVAEAQRLEAAADNAENSDAISSADPEALALITKKIEKMEAERFRLKEINVMVRRHKTVPALATAMAVTHPDTPRQQLEVMAQEMLTPDWCGRIGVAPYRLTNLGAEIRRMKERLAQVSKVQAGFTPFTIESHMGQIGVELKDGQIQVEFMGKPSEATRSILKRSPLVLKWSSYSRRWVRKHTAATASAYFRAELIRALTAAEGEV